MVTVKILGTGCPNCKQLEAITRRTIDALGAEVDVIKVSDPVEIIDYPILGTPALVMNERVLSAGRIPTVAEMTSWLKSAMEQS